MRRQGVLAAPNLTIVKGKSKAVVNPIGGASFVGGLGCHTRSNSRSPLHSFAKAVEERIV